MGFPFLEKVFSDGFLLPETGLEKIKQIQWIQIEIPASSFPRRRESRLRDSKEIFKDCHNSKPLDSRLRGNDGMGISIWIYIKAACIFRLPKDG